MESSCRVILTPRNMAVESDLGASGSSTHGSRAAWASARHTPPGRGTLDTWGSKWRSFLHRQSLKMENCEV